VKTTAKAVENIRRRHYGGEKTEEKT